MTDQEKSQDKQEDAKLDGKMFSGVADVAFCFDTTGSMSSCIADVRTQLRELIVSISKDIPGLRIAMIAHGDYCDGPNCITVLDFTNNHDAIIEFVNNAPNTGGGDADECYELALNKARNLSWSGNGGAFVMIGDADPHGVNYPGNTDKLDWRVELKELCSIVSKVYLMKCMRGSSPFWAEAAEMAGTPLLHLDNFEESATTLGAIAYASTGDANMLRGYARSVANSGVISATMACTFDEIATNLEKTDEE